MHIKSYETRRFAGLKDVNIDFENGLNVILGDNESGKSTIINGIHSTIFKDTKLKNSLNADKDFKKNYFPVGGGDIIDGSLEIITADGIYRIVKKWKHDEIKGEIELVTPQGEVINDPDRINAKLFEIMEFGENTYSKIVFAKQKELKKSISSIIEDSDISKEINDVLRRAFLNLDGISLDKIEENIEAEIKRLYDKWDIARNAPEKNRGINNKYKVGLGEIIKAYYEKEELKFVMEETKKAQEKYDRICEELKSLREKTEKNRQELKELLDISDDVNKRAVIEAELGKIENQYENIKEISIQWPKTDVYIEMLEEQKKDAAKEIEELEKTREKAGKAKRKKEIASLIENVEKIQSEIEINREKLSEIPEVKAEDIRKLDELISAVKNTESALKAGKIKALVKKGTNIVIKNADSEEKAEIGKEYSSNGYFRIENDDIEIEIKSAEIDFDELIKKREELKGEYEKLLENLKVKDIEEARGFLLAIRNYSENITKLQNSMRIYLNNQDIEELKKELSQYENIDENINEDEIYSSLKVLNSQLIAIESDLKAKVESRKNWEGKYGNIDNLINIQVELKAEKSLKERERDGLKPLPEKFSHIGQFQNRLNFLRQENEKDSYLLQNLMVEENSAKNELSEESYEEINSSYVYAEEKFHKLLQRGEKLLYIQKVFLETKEEMSQNPLKPLVDEFENILGELTEGRYSSIELDEKFNLDLKKEGITMPVELLSAGTYDTVSLALRFALLKYIFKDEGYVVLDDCLVDLDENRKKASVKLIQNLAKDYQVIFTTCDRETAKMLGGNLIEI